MIPPRPLGPCLAAVVLFAPGSAQTGPADPESAVPRSASVCQGCHAPIYRQWERSTKARSWTNPVFQAFLAEAKAALGESIQSRCIACHAPLASVRGDASVADPLSREGITCNFCHTVSSVEGNRKPASYRVDLSNPDLMRGPYSDAEPGGAHRFVYSELHGRSEFCAACHSVVHPQTGAPIEETYDDWRASSAAEAGIQCQTCHMPEAPGKASPLAKKRRKAVSAHTFWGPGTPGALDSVATLEAAVRGRRVRLTVTNIRPGHSIPGGGNSMRALILTATFYDAAGAKLDSVIAERYGTVFSDSTGRSPVPKWLAHRVVRANRIPPDSSRTAWVDPPAAAVRVEAVLRYHAILPEYMPMLRRRVPDWAGRDPIVLARATAMLR